MVESVNMKDVDKVLAMINKSLGGTKVRRLGDAGPSMQVETIESGSLTLDAALGVWGVPLGRTVEIFGPEMGGKTTISLYMIASAQRAGKLAAFIDAEHALNPELARVYGVDLDNLVINQPENGEEAFNVIEALVRSGKFSIIVLDSVASLVPEAEADAPMEQQSIGLHARLMSKALRKLTPACAQNNCTVVFINQLREKVGVMYGNPETTPGGRALKFYASVRIEVRKGEPIKVKDQQVGHVVKFNVVKNKVAVPYKKGSFNLIYGVGIDAASEVADVAAMAGILTRSGAWYYYTNAAGEQMKWNGLDAVKQAFKDDAELCREIRATLMQSHEPVSLVSDSTGEEVLE